MRHLHTAPRFRALTPERVTASLEQTVLAYARDAAMLNDRKLLSFGLTTFKQNPIQRLRRDLSEGNGSKASKVPSGLAVIVLHGNL